VITIDDIRPLVGTDNAVTFNADPARFFITAVSACGDPGCTVQPCAGVVELEPFDDPGHLIRDVHIGATWHHPAGVA
jgi:hypothetical protein